jgi:hypothetical protein
MTLFFISPRLCVSVAKKLPQHFEPSAFIFYKNCYNPQDFDGNGEKKMKKILSSVAFVALFSLTAFADVRLPDTPKPTPAPKQKKAIESNLEIRLDRNANEAKLIIPKSQLKQLRAELEELDNDADTTASLGVTKTQTIVSGLFLSLAFVFGGVWFVRSWKMDGKINKTIAAGAVLFLVGSAATIVFGNAAPPPRSRLDGKLFNKEMFRVWNLAYGKVKIELSESENSIQLIVPDKEEEKR